MLTGFSSGPRPMNDIDDDFREPATLDDVVNELSQLHDDLVRIAGDIKTELEQPMDQITHAINELSHGLSYKLNRIQFEIQFGLGAVIIGIIGIIGTLRQWF